MDKAITETDTAKSGAAQKWPYWNGNETPHNKGNEPGYSYSAALNWGTVTLVRPSQRLVERPSSELVFLNRKSPPLQYVSSILIASRSTPKMVSTSDERSNRPPNSKRPRNTCTQRHDMPRDQPKCPHPHDKVGPRSLPSPSATLPISGTWVRTTAWCVAFDPLHNV